ncbi:uncharacterized protein [Antedon mediterranea]|uniref:uncharacterized protein isoform X1 n=1 Tax=Antedon mediterranea TaxID=105859 RepID=UPI003AF827F1
MDRENFDPWSFYPNAFVDGEYDSVGMGKTKSSHVLLADLTSESVECAKRVNKVLRKSKQIHEEAKAAMSLARNAVLKAEVVAAIAKDASTRCSALVEAVMINQKIFTEDQVYWSASPEAKQDIQIEEFQQVLNFGSLARQGVNLSPTSFDTHESLDDIVAGISRLNSRNIGCQSSRDVENSHSQTDEVFFSENFPNSQEMQIFSTDSSNSETGCDCSRISIDDKIIRSCRPRQHTHRRHSGEEIIRRRENIPQTVHQSSEDFIERLACSLPTVDENIRAEVCATNVINPSIRNHGNQTDQDDHNNVIKNNARLISGNHPLMTIQQQRLQSTEAIVEEQSQAKAQLQSYNQGNPSPEVRSRPGSPLVTDEENRRITMQLLPSSSPQLFQPKKTRSSSSTDM